VEIFDYELNKRIYTFHTTESHYSLPEGFLEEGNLYRYRVQARREFFDQNVDNMSSTPPNLSDSPVFSTSLAADTDGDGMDDTWEIANFGDLSRDGTGDFDGDGLTDLEEFLYGTDPNTPEYILTSTVSGAGGISVDPTGIYYGPGQSIYSSGTEVTLDPILFTGWEFTGWTGCDSVDGTTCYVTMNTSKSVTATFTLSTPPTLDGSGGIELRRSAHDSADDLPVGSG
jgi:hypothetical protein